MYVCIYVCGYICIIIILLTLPWQLILWQKFLLTTHTQPSLIWQTSANPHTTRTHTSTNTNHESVTWLTYNTKLTHTNNSAYFTRPAVRQQWARSGIIQIEFKTILIMAKRVGMSRNNTTFGKDILYFMSRYHIHISSNTIFATFIAVPNPNPKTINPSWRRLLNWNASRVTQYIQLYSHYIPLRILVHSP